MDNNKKYVMVLIDTLEKQTKVLKDILEITQRQSEIAKSETFNETMLEESLNQKEILIARLNELDEGFSTVYERVRREIQGKQELYKDDLHKMQGLIKECTDLGVEIKVLEERNRERLTQCFSAKHKEYASQRTAASVASTYHKAMNNTQIVDSFFFNKKK